MTPPAGGSTPIAELRTACSSAAGNGASFTISGSSFNTSNDLGEFLSCNLPVPLSVDDLAKGQTTGMQIVKAAVSNLHHCTFQDCVASMVATGSDTRSSRAAGTTAVAAATYALNSGVEAAQAALDRNNSSLHNTVQPASRHRPCLVVKAPPKPAAEIPVHHVQHSALQQPTRHALTYCQLQQRHLAATPQPPPMAPAALRHGAQQRQCHHQL